MRGSVRAFVRNAVNVRLAWRLGVGRVNHGAERMFAFLTERVGSWRPLVGFLSGVEFTCGVAVVRCAEEVRRQRDVCHELSGGGVGRGIHDAADDVDGSEFRQLDLPGVTGEVRFGESFPGSIGPGPSQPVGLSLQFEPSRLSVLESGELKQRPGHCEDQQYDDQHDEQNGALPVSVRLMFGATIHGESCGFRTAVTRRGQLSMV